MQDAVQRGVEAAFDHIVLMMLIAFGLLGIGRTFRHAWENAREKKRQRKIAEEHAKNMWALAQQARIERMRASGGFWGRFGWRALPRTFDERQELNRQMAALFMIGLFIAMLIGIALLN